MTEPERLDAPNQQVVRPDGSGPADEGTGAGEAPKPKRKRDDGADKPPAETPAPEQPREG